MKIEIEIAKIFNFLFVGPPFLGEYNGETVIFWDFPEKLNATQEMGFINFMLNVDESMLNDFKKKSPYFDDIINANVEKDPVAIAINKKATLKFSALKGADIKLTNRNKNTDIYYNTYPYLLKTGDYFFYITCYLPDAPYFMEAYFVAGPDACAIIEFDSDSYDVVKIIAGDASEARASLRQAPICNIASQHMQNTVRGYNHVPGKFFGDEFVGKFFFPREPFTPYIAVKDEE